MMTMTHHCVGPAALSRLSAPLCQRMSLPIISKQSQRWSLLPREPLVFSLRQLLLWDTWAATAAWKTTQVPTTITRAATAATTNQWKAASSVFKTTLSNRWINGIPLTTNSPTPLLSLLKQFQSKIVSTWQSAWPDMLETAVWYMSSTVKKRRWKMNKHKLRKRRKRERRKSK